MPITTITLSNTNQDGNTQLHANTSNASNVNNLNGSFTPFFGPVSGSPNNNPNCAYFCFLVDNLPQGTLLNSATIAIRNQTTAYTNGSSSRIYIAVENNLFTEPVAGTGRINRGVKGKTPWDRLGRITEAVGFFGNRCGPTHSHPSGLSGYGASVRDPYALLTKAYCTDQGDAAALGRSLPAPSREPSENFAAALQPLINDPGWNSTSQWVMVYVFSDSIIPGSTVWGVGNLEGILYNNGMRASTITAAGQGTAAMYTSGFPDTFPILTLDYNSPSLNTALGSGSVSSGRASFAGKPALIGRMRNRRMEDDNKKYVIGMGGVEDYPAAAINSVMNPNRPDWSATSVPEFGATAVRLASAAPAHSPNSQGLYFVDLPNKSIWMRWDVDQYAGHLGSLPTYSMRFYHSVDGEESADYYRSVIRITDGGGTETLRWRLLLGPLFWESGNRFQPVISWSGGSSGLATQNIVGRTNQAQYWRYEIQVSEYTTPKVRVRIYDGNSTTPFAVRTANPPSVIGDRFKFGDTDEDPLSYSWRISDVEIWSDYYLNGQFPVTDLDTGGTPYVPQPIAYFINTEDGAKPADVVGKITSIDPDGSNAVLAPVTLGDAQTTGWIKSNKTYTTYTNLQYGTGLRRLDLYVPDGPVPDGGWPVLQFSHGGFFIAGNKDVVSPQLVNNLVYMGFAVASIQYILSGTYLQGLGQTVPAYNPSTDQTGYYPSWILNFKEATVWLKNNAGTYNLNPNKFIASGVSAGGYVCMGAAFSRGVTNDGGGRNLTLAGNTGPFFTPNVPDPTYLGVYAWCPPISMTALRTSDKTNTEQWWVTLDQALVKPGFPNAGVFTCTSRLFMGRTADTGSTDTTHTGIDDMVRVNAANLPLNVAVARAGWDFLVPYNVDGLFPDAHDHHKILVNALDDVEGSLPSGFEFTDHLIYNALHHTVTLQDMEYTKLEGWLRQVVA